MGRIAYRLGVSSRSFVIRTAVLLLAKYVLGEDGDGLPPEEYEPARYTRSWWWKRFAEKLREAGGAVLARRKSLLIFWVGGDLYQIVMGRDWLWRTYRNGKYIFTTPNLMEAALRVVDWYWSEENGLHS